MFYKSKTYADGRGYRCKPCDNEARKKYNERDPDRFREKNINRVRKYKYGISSGEVEQMYKDQNGLCKICNIEMDTAITNYNSKTRQVIDHCHSTNKVRGLLCTRCNQALGLFRDDPEILRQAILYVTDIH